MVEDDDDNCRKITKINHFGGNCIIPSLGYFLLRAALIGYVFKPYFFTLV